MSRREMYTLPMGAKIGILGGGQLGKMLCQAATKLGFQTAVYSDVDGCANDASHHFYKADWHDTDALGFFAKGCDVITLEFENIPAVVFEHIAGLQNPPQIFPSLRALQVSQNRISEKALASQLGIPTPRYFTSSDPAPPIEFIKKGVIIKTATGGYDGNGQWSAQDQKTYDEAITATQGVPYVVEERVNFTAEFSLILVRAQDGSVRFYPPFINAHEDGILRRTRFVENHGIPEQTLCSAARKCAILARELDIVGLLAIEMFLMPDGSFLFNEIAPRPHNSGHVTMDAASTSQFENHIRAVAGLPLGSCKPIWNAVMTNLIGEVKSDVWDRQAFPTSLYLYGKDARPRRKMGHVNMLTSSNIQGHYDWNELLAEGPGLEEG